MFNLNNRILITVLLLTLTVACGDDNNESKSSGAGIGTSSGSGTGASEGRVNVPKTYAFKSRFDDSKSGVSYSGQTFRQILISEQKKYLSNLTEKIKTGKWVETEKGKVKEALNFYYDYKDSAGKDLNFSSISYETVQKKYGDVSTSNLKKKFAGNDKAGQHKDWTKEFAGWGKKGSITPEGLLFAWFDMVDALAIDWVNSKYPKDPVGKDITKVFINDLGHDLQQLIQKFLLGAVAFSQGADDYLDDDLVGKGLKSDNTKPYKEGALYTALEHGWDEGFGYFGAARDYNDQTDAIIKSPGYKDSNGDKKIDLKSEQNYGHSINAAKRDLGAKKATDFTKGAFDAFLTGRAIISSAKGNLSVDQLNAVQKERDTLLVNWEKAISATAIHYINDLIRDIAASPQDFYNVSKHWSELKGFSLAFQFNRRSPLTAADFEKFHRLIGDKPVLESAGQAKQDEYVESLKEARAILAKAYSFAKENVGDDKGENGW